MKATETNEAMVPQHLDGDELIAYLDGELSLTELSEARTHLESCWSCRGRLAQVQGSIEHFMRLRREKLTPRLMPPAGPAVERFRRRLTEHAAVAVLPHAAFKRSLHRFFHDLRTRVATWPAPSLAAKLAGLAALVTLAGYFILVSNEVATVTASELLRRAKDAHVRQTTATPQAVIHQKIVLKRRVAFGREVAVGVELWRDTASSQYRRAIISQELVSGQNASTAKADAAELSARAIVDFERISQANGVDSSHPLSAQSFERWRGTVEPKHEEVSKSVQNGADVLSLRVVRQGSVSAGQVSEAEFVVRANDWHPMAERWQVKTVTGSEEFYLSETSFEVVSRSALSPTIFSNVENKASVVAGKRPEASSIDPVSHPLPPAASANLEIEVLSLLNRAGANLGEQVSVTRTSDDRLYVQGVVETAQRKAEILSVLRPVIANPAVVVNIKTAEENRQALAEAKTVIVQGGAVTENATIPAYDELRAHFLSQGVSAESVDDRIRVFSRQVLNRSRQALRHAWALRNLSGRLKEASLEQLSPEARNKWLGMVQEHAAAVERETKALRRELSTVFRNVGGAGLPSVGSVETDGELTRALNRLVDACASNDGTIRVAFTVSSASAASGLGNPQFWNSLRSAEETASRIQLAAEKLKKEP